MKKIDFPCLNDQQCDVQCQTCKYIFDKIKNNKFQFNENSNNYGGNMDSFNSCNCKKEIVLLSGQKVIKHKDKCNNKKIIKPKNN